MLHTLYHVQLVVHEGDRFGAEDTVTPVEPETLLDAFSQAVVRVVQRVAPAVVGLQVVRALGMPQRVADTGSSAQIGRHGDEGLVHLPGTYVLVGVFFVAFVLYYFVNWKYLSELWPLS
jgi:hypothetical protein